MKSFGVRNDEVRKITCFVNFAHEFTKTRL